MKSIARPQFCEHRALGQRFCGGSGHEKLGGVKCVDDFPGVEGIELDAKVSVSKFWPADDFLDALRERNFRLSANWAGFEVGPVRAQTEISLTQRIQKVIGRPEFAHANFGIEFYSLDTGKVVYALNAAKLFVPASTTKTLTEGTVLAKLGPGYRFHTRVYRTGSVDKHGTLKGDLILVASGDPNLSNRIQPDGTLAFADEDHSYGRS